VASWREVANAPRTKLTESARRRARGAGTDAVRGKVATAVEQRGLALGDAIVCDDLLTAILNTPSESLPPVKPESEDADE